MSAVRIAIGDTDTRVFGADENASPKDKLLGFLGKVTKWIPADVMAIYGAAIIAMQPKPAADGSAPPAVVSVELWVAFLVATPILVGILGWVAGSERLARRVLLSVPAFIIWTASVPHSAWEKLPLFTDSTVLVLAVLAVVAAGFAPFADKVVGES